MSVTLTGSGGIFTRLGALGGRLLDIEALAGGTATARVLSGSSLVTTGAAIEAAWAAGTALYKPVDGFIKQFATVNNDGSFQVTLQSIFSLLQQIAQDTLQLQVNADTPLAALANANALAVLISQMNTSADSVAASTTAAGAQTAVGSPTGTPIFVASVKNPYGVNLDYLLPDKMTFSCSADSVTGGAVARQEQFAITTRAPAPSFFDYNYGSTVYGSGASGSLTLVDSQQNNSGGNLLWNSSFSQMTTPSSSPDNWLVLVGTAGTDVNRGASGYDDSLSLEFLGDGSTLHAVTQPFGATPSTSNASGGTSGTLLPNTQYAFNCWIKMSAMPSTGVLKFDLTDGSNTVLNDAAGTANTITKSLTAVSTSWVNVSGTFRTPYTVPTQYRLRIRESTAIDNAKNVFIDSVALTPMTQLYTGGSLVTGGPWLAGFAGATNPISNPNSSDAWTMAITNTYGVFQKLFQVMFDMNSLGLAIPSSGSNTINDNLVA